MKSKNIILILGDDSATLSSAQSIAKQLPNSEIKRFSPNCLIGLSPADVTRITVVGHAGSKSYGESHFSPKQFVRAFDEAREIAGLKKGVIKGLRCFGCELGLINKQGNCYAQEMANEFALQGYHLNLSAFTNRHSTTLQNMIVGVRLDGSINVYGYTNPFNTIRGEALVEQLKAKSEEIERLQAKVSFLDFLLGRTKATKAVDKAVKEYEDLLEKQNKIRVPIAREEHPIEALDHDKKYQFLPSLNPKELEEKVSDLRERINTCEHNFKMFQDFGDFSLASQMQTRQKELEEQLRTIENYLTNEKNKDLIEEVTPEQKQDSLLGNLKKEQQLEKRAVQSWLKSAWQGVKQFFSDLRMKSSATEDVVMSELSPKTQVVERTNDTRISSYRKSMVTLDSPVIKSNNKPIEPMEMKDKELRDQPIAYTSYKKDSPQAVARNFKQQLTQLRQGHISQEQEEPQNETHSQPELR
ncbi:hypothetical protein DGG96_15935 [Legionella qingyii]|uniref:Uncharacterized protein n=1 Tax=Legionella qingyii TaxID=2184757 RepID=A0A317U1P8_9GAMM|nr:hypothetical protein [Legionella qingyii]PWY54646.1 hypothetical protein DGG96_15935 [Legionella qingyii]RUR20484.1 hypothetical protein ELY20_14570 [Legionella qingyii]RUR22640.1 hypothetical protein ELY16_14595 [Legionella qingyii]